MFPNKKFIKANYRSTTRTNSQNAEDSSSYRVPVRTCTPITNVYREGLNSVLLPSRRGPSGVYTPLNKSKNASSNSNLPSKNQQQFAGKTLPSIRKSRPNIKATDEDTSINILPKQVNPRKSRRFLKTSEKNVERTRFTRDSIQLRYSGKTTPESSDIEVDFRSELEVMEEIAQHSSDTEIVGNNVTYILPNAKSDSMESVTTAPIAAFRKISDRQLIQLQKNKNGSYAALEDQLALEYFCRNKELLQAEFELNFIKEHFGYISSSSSDDSRTNSKRNKYNDDRDRVEKTLPDSSTISNYCSITGCFYLKWSDGEYVKIVCPQCGKMNFDTQLEFLTHLKERHEVEYPDQRSALIACGVPVNESEIPHDHPCRKPENILQSLSDSRKRINLDSSVDYDKFNEVRRCLEADRPKIKVYDDIVDFEVIPPSPGLKTRSGRRVVKQKNSVRIMDSVSANENGSLDPAKTIFGSRPEDMIQVIGASGVSSLGDPNDKLIFAQESEAKAATVSTINQMPSSPSNPFIGNEDNSDVLIGACMSPSSVRAEELESIITEDEASSIEGKDLSISAQFGFDFVSRFHIKKSIIIGNTSKLVTEEPGSSPHYRWLIYVTGPIYDPDITSFISKVKFVLHPSYAPYDIIEVKKPPFILPGYGWGEFPVRAQLHFKDSRNKPIELVHNLTLSDVDSKAQDQISNTYYDIELDRDTKFFSSIIAFDSQYQETVFSPEPIVNDEELQGTFDNALGLTLDSAATPLTTVSGLGLNDTIQKILLKLLTMFPIISDKKELFCSLPYPISTSWDEFTLLNYDQQQSIEFYRAKIILDCLRLEISTQNSSALDAEQIDLISAQHIINWCRVFDAKLSQIQPQIELFPKFSAEADNLLCQGCFDKVNRKTSMCLSCSYLVTKVDSFSTPISILHNIFNYQQKAISHEKNIILDSHASLKQNSITFFEEESGPGFNLCLSEIQFVSDTIDTLKLTCFTASVKNKSSDVYNVLALATRLFLSKLLKRILDKQNHMYISKSQNLLNCTAALNIDLSQKSRHNLFPKTNSPKFNLTPIHIWEALSSIGSRHSSAAAIMSQNDLSEENALNSDISDDPLDFLTNIYLGAVA